MIVKDSSNQHWLAGQLIHETARTPIPDGAYMLPNWARFFAIKADRSVPDPEAAVADRLDWANYSIQQYETAGCTCLILPFFVSEDKKNEFSETKWSKQSNGTTVDALHAILEGHQLLPSDPNYGGE